MDDFQFLSYTQLEEIFKSNNIESLILRLDKEMLIGSTSDMLYITEQFKKGNIKIEFKDLISLFKNIDDSAVYYPEIDRDRLLDNLFESNKFNAVLKDKPSNKNISPRFSISLIALFPNEITGCSDELFNSMEEYYLNFESYD